MSSFDDLHPALQYHVVNTLGWAELRPTQKEAIGPILSGKNVLILAPTAGGKTEAALWPILSRVASEGWRGLTVLYLCPLKALLNNLIPRVQKYASFAGLRASVWHGDIGEAARRRILSDPPEILLTTPESLEAVLISVRTDHKQLLGRVRAVIVDELHAFAGDDRGWHVLFLLARLEHLTAQRIQRVGLSATVGNPDELLDWLSSGRGGQVIGRAQTPSEGNVTVDYVGSIANAVIMLSRLFRGERRLVFAESRSRVEEIAAGLRGAGVRTFVSHASLSLDERRQAEVAFVQEPDCLIVSTSTLELGLDVGDLDRVIQVGAPHSVASFLQRMGRTGRRHGTNRNCLFLATDDDELLAALAITHLWRQGTVEPVQAPPFPAHIYAQQVMALALQLGGVTRSDLVEWLGDVADAVPKDAREAILTHMLANAILAQDSGVIGLGPRGEREFGRRHFSELVAAFSSPLMLTVYHGHLELGTVHPASLARRADQRVVTLSLGGRGWRVTEIDWPRRKISVLPADSAGRSRWLGSGRLLPLSICRAEEQVVAHVDPDCTISKRAGERVLRMRDRLCFVDGKSLPLVSSGEGNVVLWLFAGGVASASIARALNEGGMRTVGWDDLSVTVQVPDIETVRRELVKVDPAAAHPALPDDMSARLKFGSCLPDRIAEEVIVARTSARVAVSNALSRPMRGIVANRADGPEGSD